MVSHESQNLAFRLHCPDVKRVYLVTEHDDGTTRTSPMNQSRPGLWQLRLNLPAGAYNFHYFASDGQSITTFGGPGLEITRG